MVENVLLNDEVLRPAGTVAGAVVVLDVGPVVVLDVVFLDDEEHAAPTRASVTATETTPTILNLRFVTPFLLSFRRLLCAVSGLIVNR
jgi:hypothetical protein